MTFYKLVVYYFGRPINNNKDLIITFAFLVSGN